MKIEQRKYLILFIIIFTVISITVGFSAYTDTLSFSDITAQFRLPDELRVTNFFVTSSTNSGESTYDEYNVHNISAGVTLPNQNSTVTYRVEVTNLGSFYAQIESITGLPSNITYELSDYTLGDDICDANDRCKNGVVKDFLITFKYTTNGFNSSQTSYLLNLTVNFTKNYNVEYIGNMFYATPGTREPSGVGSGSVNVNYNPYSNELVLSGGLSVLNSRSDSISIMCITGVTLTEGDTYIAELDYISGSVSSSGSYSKLYITGGNSSQQINFDLLSTTDAKTPFTISSTLASNNASLCLRVSASAGNGLEGNPSTASFSFTNYKAKVSIYKEEKIRVPYPGNYVLPSSNPIRNGFTFDGWYTLEQGGTKITSSTAVSGDGDQTLYAQWIDNDVITAPTISYETNYVTDGLGILFDGRNNTGNGYDASATTWTDLSGNSKDGSVKHGTWNYGYITLNGTNAGVVSKAYNNTRYTMEAVFYLETANAGANVISNFETGGGGIYLKDGYISYSLYISSSFRVISAPDLAQAGEVYYVSGTYDGSYMRLYVNGEEVASSPRTGNVASPQNSTRFAVGCNPSGSSCDSAYLNGNVYAARVYNRGLTEEEVIHNYLIDKSYLEDYTSISPEINITGGSSTLGDITGYVYSINNENNYTEYDLSNKPTVTIDGINTVYARAVNINTTKGNLRSNIIRLDQVAPTGNLSFLVNETFDNELVVQVSFSGTDVLSGIKNRYGFHFSNSSTCDSTITDFDYTNIYLYNYVPDLAGTIYACVRVEDNAGNVAYISDTIPAVFYQYTGGYQTFTASASGYYKITAFGAKGGATVDDYTTTYGGGTASGYINLNQNDTLYLYVGGVGSVTGSGANKTAVGGWNGGGDGFNSTSSGRYAGSGGGATDIRYFGSYTPTSSDLDWDSTLGLNSRIMVAGGGGGSWYYNKNYYGIGSLGGGLIGGEGLGNDNGTRTTAYGGTQNSTTFGIGTSGTTTGYPGGGGGYYGGGNALRTAAGGSGFISGYAGVNAITSSTNRTHTNNTKHYSNKYFIHNYMDSEIIERETTTTGDGVIIIEYKGTNPSELNRINSSLNNVRYIKDCLTGKTNGNNAEWIEIQAIKDGVNLAKGKTVTGTVAVDTSVGSGTYTTITNGIITSDFARASSSGLQCVTVDLGNTYNLDEIAVWHVNYSTGWYSEQNNVTYTSSDNTNFMTTIDVSRAKLGLLNGKRINAWTSNGRAININGAISETITYTGPINGNVTLDETGYARIQLPNGTYTFTSSVAKSITNVSNAYTQTVVIDDNTTTVNFYPDTAVYWYGNGQVAGSSLYNTYGGIAFDDNTYNGPCASCHKLETNRYGVYIANNGNTWYSAWAASGNALSIAKPSSGNYSYIKAYVYGEYRKTNWGSGNCEQYSFSSAGYTASNIDVDDDTYIENSEYLGNNGNSTYSNDYLYFDDIVSLPLTNAPSTIKLKIKSQQAYCGRNYTYVNAVWFSD